MGVYPVPENTPLWLLLKLMLTRDIIHLLQLTFVLKLTIEPEINSLSEDEVKHNQALLVLRSICNQVRRLSTNIEKHDQYKDVAILAVYEDKREALEEIPKIFQT